MGWSREEYNHPSGRWNIFGYTIHHFILDKSAATQCNTMYSFNMKYWKPLKRVHKRDNGAVWELPVWVLFLLFVDKLDKITNPFLGNYWKCNNVVRTKRWRSSWFSKDGSKRIGYWNCTCIDKHCMVTFCIHWYSNLDSDNS